MLRSDRLAPSTVALVALLLTMSLRAVPPDTSTPTLPWPATDDLGGSLPLAEDVGPSRPDRFVRGKPLMICDPAQASEEVRAFFTLRRAHWPFTMVNTERAWHWEATYPQPYGYVDDPKRPEQVNVSVAQNLRRSDGTRGTFSLPVPRCGVADGRIRDP